METAMSTTVEKFKTTIIMITFGSITALIGLVELICLVAYTVFLMLRTLSTFLSSKAESFQLESTSRRITKWLNQNWNQVQPEWHEVDLKNLERMYNQAVRIDYPNPTRKIVIGDSHSICMYRPGWTVNSVPFKTLNGAINDGFDKYIPFDYEEIECYFGNIDIRHHVIRLGQKIEDLADRYIEEANKYNAKIYELLPIEDVSRRIPQSGYYKGQPFYGSWSERNDARNKFNDYIEKEYGPVISIIKKVSSILNTWGNHNQYIYPENSIHIGME